ncbi:MAG: response regulator transcription factor [Oscillospiraceae bacterium]|nr:response regulator transcription factor [Oscillospiraceae bacterium]MBQ9982073.1 response regulator transcription factor [Oscillospiraceae bacterium]
MNNRYKILVVEDEKNIRSFVKTILNANEYQVILSDSCQNGIMMFTSYIPDLVILDLGLPDKDGIEFIRYVRTSSATPIIVLSARSTEEDKVSALDAGANDYITKPFGTAELVARIRAALRSYRVTENAILPDGKFTLFDLCIDYNKRIVTVAGNEIKLTQTEYNIMSYLSQNTDKVLTYATIIKEIWGYDDVGSIKKLQVNMANIRKKLGSKPGETNYIINELGVGYRMRDKTNI